MERGVAFLLGGLPHWTVSPVWIKWPPPPTCGRPLYTRLRDAERRQFDFAALTEEVQEVVRVRQRVGPGRQGGVLQ